MKHNFLWVEIYDEIEEDQIVVVPDHLVEPMEDIGLFNQTERIQAGFSIAK